MKKIRIRYALLVFVFFLAMVALRPFLRQRTDLLAQGNIELDGRELNALLKLHSMDSLPDYNGHYFLSAGGCENCHGHDPNNVAMVDPMGNDINVVDSWRTTMMALASKDPFWKAQVSHEVLTNPGHQAVLEEKCLSCHAPLGRYTHYFQTHGQSNYSMAMLETDTLGLDGVSCMSCHSQKQDSFGTTFSGILHLDTTRTVYGPFAGPVVAPMFTSFHLVAAYGPHVQESKLCADCHTLVTQTVDLQGTPTGGEFVEQATYHEWLNSKYPLLDISCQGCHMPTVNSGVYLSGPDVSSTNPRMPFAKHHFAGSNVFMLKMMKTYADSLGIQATPTNFDSTIARTEYQLHNTLDMTLTEMSRDADSVKYDLKLTNRAGHKFPSGYPSRRAFIEFVVRDANGDTIFQSGMLGSNHEVVGQDPGFEPHHDLINDPGQAQIYEFIMGDVNGNVTTTLERSATHLKDNRLVPQGFSSTFSNFNDTTEIAGNALTDPDFNHAGATEGTGSDIVHYHVPLAGYTGSLQLSARVWFQTVRPGWLDETFAHSSPDIDRFKRWFFASDQSPVLVAELLTQDVIIGTQAFSSPSIMVYPNPTQNGWVNILLPEETEHVRIRVYDLNGKLLLPEMDANSAIARLHLPFASGRYMVELDGGNWRKTISVIKR